MDAYAAVASKEAAGLPPRSLWCRWAAYCVRYPLSAGELKSHLKPLPTCRHLLRSSGLDGDDSKRLRAQLGITQEEIELATGSDLAYPSEFGTVLQTEVRYCRECLRLGFHSMLHQHLGVTQCPVHQQPMQVGCFVCGSPLAVTVEGIARTGLTCGRCAVVFSVPRHQALQEAQATNWEPMKTLRHTLSLLDTKPRAAWPRTNSSVAAVRARQLLRWTAWASHGAVPAFKEEVIATPDRPDGKATSEVSPVLEELVFIHDMLAEHHHAIADIAAAVGEGCGARIRGMTTVAAAAFYRTCLNYRLRQDLYGRPDSRRTLEFSYLLQRETPIGPVPRWVHRLSARSEVRAVFALTLLEFSRLDLLQEVAWNGVPQPNDHGTAWRWDVDEEGATFVRLRTRASVPMLRRLVRRIGARLLHADPDPSLREALLAAQRPSRTSFVQSGLA